MLWRRSKTKRAKRAKRAATSRLPSGEEVRGQVAELTDDLGEALESARDSIARAMSSMGRRGAEAGSEATRRTSELGKEVGRKGAAVGAELGRKTRRRARDVAREAAEHLPDPDQVAEMARRAEERLLPERSKQHRKDRRKRTRRRFYASAGVAGLGVLLGWLTAPKKGDEARQALKERASAASGKIAEMRAAQQTAGAEPGAGLSTSTASGTSEPKQTEAEVTPIHHADGAATSERRS
ncbi:MAG TPA: YtxH domain-containing protein [Actinomycetes bacterium]|jgi:hypothetical protein|nr:YtxH domain-containing protein [Actinomycetes bacterium]